MLKAHKLFTGYNGRRVLQGVDLSIAAGQIFGVVGPNGAGKSTLVKALSGTLELESGQVLVDGKDIHRMPIAQRARTLAVVPQARSLPPAFTGWETVSYGRTPYLNWLGNFSAIDERIIHVAMERTDTLHLAERRLGELSGGEQQRLLLARALAQEAEILLLDEPTAHLDLQYQVSLLDLLRTLTREDGLAVLLVMHDLNMVGWYADQVGLLVQGNFAAFGTPAEVLRPEILSPAYQLPLRVVQMEGDDRPVILPAVVQ